jgi:hypothetical protein
LPSPPPISKGSWHVTASVWQIWLFPVLNSPKISVIEPVSIPPASRVSSCFDPVVIEMSSLRRWCISVAVVKPIGTSLDASASSFEAFCSDIPLICSSARRGLYIVSIAGFPSVACFDSRVCNRFDSVKTTFDDKLNISCSKTVHSLCKALANTRTRR